MPRAEGECLELLGSSRGPASSWVLREGWPLGGWETFFAETQAGLASSGAFPSLWR